MKNSNKIEAIRKIYLTNRNNTIEDFNNALKEVQKDSPSIGGKIAGMDFRQFSVKMIFNTIIEQEEYAISSSPYIIQNEEKKILKDMIKKAKKIFGKEYINWYKAAKEEQCIQCLQRRTYGKTLCRNIILNEL